MLAKECDILAKIHIFEVISNKTAVAALDALAEFFYNVLIIFHKNPIANAPGSDYFTTPRFEFFMKSIRRSTSGHALISDAIRSVAWVVFSFALSSK